MLIKLFDHEESWRGLGRKRGHYFAEFGRKHRSP
jgi:hypothetical protein